MTLPEKVQLAHQLARLGVDIIEAGFPLSSPAQHEAVRRIAAEVDGPVICALARATGPDVEAAGEALAPGRRTRIHTFIATSDIHIESKFGDARYGTSLAEKRRTIRRMAVEAVLRARDFTDDVEFSAEDAGRTDLDYLCEVIRAVVEAGARTINIPDTTGYCVPDEYAAMFRAVRSCVAGYPGVVLSAHCHDDLGLALANTLAAVRAGAGQVECTINGIGERAGNAALEELVMALRVREDALACHTGVHPVLLTETSRMVSTFSGFGVPPNKAIVGRNAFCHEAGIHQDGVLKRRDTYEIMRAEDVGQRVEAIRLGRHSGRHGLFARLEELGIHVSESQRDQVYRRFLTMADHKKEITDADLRYLVDQPGGAVPEAHYGLAYMQVAVETDRVPRAVVRIRDHPSGRIREAEGTGDGPVDALFRAMDHAVKDAHTLVDYTIQSVTEGADALGVVTVTLRHGTDTFTSRATHANVLRASAEAYLGAMNQLAAFRADTTSVGFVASGIMQSFQGT